VDLSFCQLQVHPFHIPWGFDPQNSSIQFPILHAGNCRMNPLKTRNSLFLCSQRAFARFLVLRRGGNDLRPKGNNDTYEKCPSELLACPEEYRHHRDEMLSLARFYCQSRALYVKGRLGALRLVQPRSIGGSEIRLNVRMAFRPGPRGRCRLVVPTQRKPIAVELDPVEREHLRSILLLQLVL